MKMTVLTWFVYWPCPRLRTTADKLASLVAQTIKNPPVMQKTLVQSLGWEDPLEEGMATHSSILSGKLHGQEPGRLQSMGLQRVRHS